MQSFFQYQALGRRLQEQLDQNKVKTTSSSTARALNSSNQQTQLNPDYASSLASTSLEIDDNICDPEPASLEPFGTRLGASLTGVIVQEHDNTSSKAFLVGFEGDRDPLNPRNWPLTKRILCTANVGVIALVVGTAASIDSAAIPQAAAEFGVSETVEALATGLFLCGFGFGALIAGPISETIGRNPVYIGSLTLYMLFVMGAGLSQSVAGQLVCRFLAGFCGESPLSTVGGSIGDMWDPMNRLVAFPIFATLGLMGPITGPIIGGFIAESSVISWRWTEWITLIFSGLVLASIILFQPETYEPILLKWKATHLRQMTGDERYIASIELHGHGFAKRMLNSLYRPFLMIIKEPAIMLWTAYLTVIYIMLFGFLDGYSFVFSNTYGLSQGLTGLSFVGIGAGLLAASVTLTPLVYHWAKKEIAVLQVSYDTASPRLPPEFFLWYAMIGAPTIPISLFWMGWTAYPTISIWSPILASVLFGFGILSVFVSTYMYLIDSYETYAASALTMITLIRYVASGGMIEASLPMYRNLGVHWALSLLGFLGIIFTTVPYLFYRFGPWIRLKSRFAQYNN
ncbi:major facilitator superfamily domain-containing protein [Xylogone sp. PMI_703]|nr:major facilitator superfamily domain-containing protein [Xylogone sp. PMI_703]